MIKKNWVYILFALSVIVFSVTQYIKHSKNRITVKTKQTSIGWGYEIYVKDSVYISQEVIPSISGRTGFKTENDAQKVGELMVLKMKKNMIPNITEYELDSLKVIR
jgi:hypothetical protein